MEADCSHSHASYVIKAYRNGHEWVKQQLRKANISFEALDNDLRQNGP